MTYTKTLTAVLQAGADKAKAIDTKNIVIDERVLFKCLGGWVIHVDNIQATYPYVAFTVFIEAPGYSAFHGTRIVRIIIKLLEFISIIPDEAILCCHPYIPEFIRQYTEDGCPFHVSVLRQVCRVEPGITG